MFWGRGHSSSGGAAAGKPPSIALALHTELRGVRAWEKRDVSDYGRRFCNSWGRTVPCCGVPVLHELARASALMTGEPLSLHTLSIERPGERRSRREEGTSTSAREWREQLDEQAIRKAWARRERASADASIREPGSPGPPHSVPARGGRLLF